MDREAASALRPLSIGEILDVAINIYKRHAVTFFIAVLVVVAPVQLLSAVVELSAQIDEQTFTQTSPTGEVEFDTDELWVVVSAFLVIGALAVGASTLSTAACFKAVTDAYLGRRPEWRESLAFAVRRAHSVLWVTLLGMVVAGFGLLLCVIPGVWLFVAFSVAVPALLVENAKGTRALGRSRELVRGRWWPTFAILLVGFLLAFLVTALTQGALTALSFADPDNDAVAFASTAIGGTIAAVLTTPFTAAFTAVLYFDLRVRKEGFDLELLADRVGLAPGAFDPAVAPAPQAAGSDFGGEQPPYWPPPPGWRPRTGDSDAD